jgi:hypothetical protein
VVTPPVTNDFIDIDSMFSRATPGGGDERTRSGARRGSWLARGCGRSSSNSGMYAAAEFGVGLGVLVLAGFVTGVVFWGGLTPRWS